MLEYIVVVTFARNGISFLQGDKVRVLNLAERGQCLLSKSTYEGRRPQITLTEQEKEELIKEGNLKLPSQLSV